MALTNKQKLFVQEYLKDRNSARAARAAGYSHKTANVIGPENLAKPYIKKEIEKAMAIVTKDNRVTVDRVVKELSKGAFAKLDVEDMKWSDKLKCLELLCRNLGILDGNESGNQGRDREAKQTRILDRVRKAKRRGNGSSG